MYDSIDVIGFNYSLSEFDRIHKEYPDKPIFSSECCATGTTRGWYFEDSPEKGFTSAYDKDTSSWFMGRENTTAFFETRPWVMGVYQWIAFEHRGESVKWPRLCSMSGAIDLFLQKKDAFWQNQSFWIKDRPVLHVLPHWNFAGMEGEIINVWAYTNCNEVELFVNGESLGKKTAEDHFFYFDVPNVGESTIVAKAGELSDEGTIRKVEERNMDYVLVEKGAVLNWFDVDAPDGRFSLNDKISDIMSSFRGKLWFAKFGLGLKKKMDAGKKNKGGEKKSGGFDVDLKSGGGLMEMMGGFTVLRLTSMVGMMNISFTKEELLKMNKQLNRIRKPKK